MRRVSLLAAIFALTCLASAAVAAGAWDFRSGEGTAFMGYRSNDPYQVLLICEADSLYGALEITLPDAAPIIDKHLSSAKFVRGINLQVTSDTSGVQDYAAVLLKLDEERVLVRFEGKAQVYRLVDQLGTARSDIVMAIDVAESRYGNFRFSARGTTANGRKWKSDCQRLHPGA